MSQSNVIAGALVIAFLMFITVRGELPAYIELFTAKRKTSSVGGDDFKFDISTVMDKADAWFDVGSEVLGQFDFGQDGEIPDGQQVEI